MAWDGPEYLWWPQAVCWVLFQTVSRSVTSGSCQIVLVPAVCQLMLSLRLLFHWWWSDPFWRWILPDNWANGWRHQRQRASSRYSRDRGRAGESNKARDISYNANHRQCFLKIHYCCRCVGWTSSCSRNSSSWISSWYQRRRWQWNSHHHLLLFFIPMFVLRGWNSPLQFWFVQH